MAAPSCPREVTDFWGKADIRPGVRLSTGLVRVIPGVSVSEVAGSFLGGRYGSQRKAPL